MTTNDPAGPSLPWLARPQARSWTCAIPENVRSGAVRGFHASLPGYAPTPLTEVPALAGELGVGRVFVKDESSRLGLPAFKVLGASWAIHQLLTDSPTGEPVTPSAARPDALARLRTAAARRPGLILVTATDGNHGRAVARIARLTSTPARVFVPAVTDPATRAAIASENAEVTQINGSYDDAVATARHWVGDHPGAALIQDTAWPGYEDVPTWIVEGYSTLFAELGAQLAAADAAPPTLVAVPVGVGSLAQAAVMHYRADAGPGDVTAVLSVEPDTAACLLASLRSGRPTTIPTANTVMAGLNCGTISSTGWPYFSGGLDAAVAVTDDAARRAATDLAAAGISSGPSGASSLAGARAALTGPASPGRRAELGVDPASVIVLLSTEAAHPREKGRFSPGLALQDRESRRQGRFASAKFEIYRFWTSINPCSGGGNGGRYGQVGQLGAGRAGAPCVDPGTVARGSGRSGLIGPGPALWGSGRSGRVAAGAVAGGPLERWGWVRRSRLWARRRRL
jgi:diaminopropionate ammonia-lyase